MSEQQAPYGVSYIAQKVDDNTILNPTVAQFKEIADNMVATYERKNHTYNDSFGISVRKYGLIAALTRISDKFNRIENLILGAENKVPDESIEDTLIDLASYSAMTIMALRDMKANSVDFENVK